MMALLFLVWTGAFGLALANRRRASVVGGLIGLILTAAMFRYHLTDTILLGL